MAAPTFEVDVNPAVLLWARTSLGLSLDQAAKELRESANRLEELERGKARPSYDLLLRMAGKYERPLGALLLYEVPQEKPLPKDFRTVSSKKRGEFDSRTVKAVRRARALAHTAIELRKEADEPMPRFELRANEGDAADDWAMRMREILRIQERNSLETAEAAFEHLREQVEEAGILVFTMTLSQDGVRGFSLLDEEVPIVVIKRGESATARSFTLLHEVGHVLLGTAGICDMRTERKVNLTEQWCNRFAAEALAPMASVLNHGLVIQHQKDRLGKEWRKVELVKVAASFHVGPEVILRRLMDANLTTKRFYADHHEKWSSIRIFGKNKNKGGRNHPKEMLKEVGRRYVSTALKVYDRGRIDSMGLADALDLQIGHFEKLRGLLTAT